MTQSQQPAYMGEFLKTYKPPILNLNKVINAFTTPHRMVFAPSAVITRDVQFPDVSFYQVEVDYSIMSIHTDAIIIRAGQNAWVDVQFERNYLEATAHGLLKGIYWFYDGRVSPGDQANLLISLLRGKHFEMEVFIDWERNYGGRWEGLPNVVAMMQAVEQAGLDIKGVGLYTGYYFFRANSNAITNANQYNYLKTRPLWLAWYTSNPANVLIPAPWTTKLTHWQFGTPVVFWGQATSELDMNFFNGTRQEFDERYGGVTPPPGGTMPYIELKPSVAGEYRSIRSETEYPEVPHIFGATSLTNRILAGNVGKANELDYYVYPSDVYVNNVLRAKTGDKWWKVYEANGSPAAGWAAEKHLGVLYLSVRLVGEPSPTPQITHTIEVYDNGSITIDGNPVPPNPNS